MGLLDTINDARQPGGLEALARRVANNITGGILGQPEISQNIQDAYGYFLANLLQTSNSVPLKPLWMCFLDDVPDIVAEAQALDLNGEAGAHDLSLGYTGSTSSIDFRGGKAALLAQEVNTPADVYRATRVDGAENMGGFLNGVVGSQREHLPPADIAYLETNYSFTDFVLRPWAIVASYKSLKACPKTNITMIQFAKAGTDTQFKPRKIITLHNCCPIDIDSETLVYSSNEATIRKVRWHYDSYTIKSGQFIGERDLLASLDRVFNVDLSDLTTQTGRQRTLNTILGSAIGAGKGIAANFITNLAGDLGGEAEQALGIGSSPFVPSPQSSNDTVVSRAIRSAGGAGDDTVPSRQIKDDVIVDSNDTPVFQVPQDTPDNRVNLNDVINRQAAIARRGSIPLRVTETHNIDTPGGGITLQKLDDKRIENNDTPLIFPGEYLDTYRAPEQDSLRNIALKSDDVIVDRQDTPA